MTNDVCFGGQALVPEASGGFCGGEEGSQEYGVLGRGGGCSGEAVEPMKNKVE